MIGLAFRLMSVLEDWAIPMQSHPLGKSNTNFYFFTLRVKSPRANHMALHKILQRLQFSRSCIQLTHLKIHRHDKNRRERWDSDKIGCTNRTKTQVFEFELLPNRAYRIDPLRGKGRGRMPPLRGCLGNLKVGSEGAIPGFAFRTWRDDSGSRGPGANPDAN